MLSLFTVFEKRCFMFVRVLFVLAFSISCAHSEKPSEKKMVTKEKCVQEYLKYTQSNTHFSGLGEGYSVDMAKTTAQTDLMKSISVKITSTSSLSETMKEVAMESVTNSETSGDLDGVSFDTICEVGSKAYAVATLKKSEYFSQIRTKIKTVDKSVSSLMGEYKSSESNGDKIRLASEMRKLDKKSGADYEGHVAICKSFRKCSSNTDSNFLQMRRLYKKKLSKVRYNLQTNGDVGQDLMPRVKSLLQKTGLTISANSKRSFCRPFLY